MTKLTLILINGDNRVGVTTNNQSLGELNKIFCALESEYESAFIEEIEGAKVRQIWLKGETKRG